MLDSHKLKWLALITLIQLLVSILVAVIPDWGQVFFTKPDEVLFGTLIFVAFLLIDLLVLTNAIAGRSRHDEVLWLLRESCDTDLVNISRSFMRLTREQYGTRDLFVDHFKKDIRQLAAKIEEVAERRQLRVQADHFLNVDNVLDAFQGDAERIWRYTWPIDGGDEPLFDELAWKRYFERTVKMVADGDIKEVRTVMVVKNTDAAGMPRVQKLLDFFRTNKGFSCWIVQHQDFRSLCEDNGVSSGIIDFGIYANRLLFLTEQYEPHISGVFTKDPTTIKHYCHLFDSMWGSASVAKPNPSTATQRVTLDELYAFDASSVPASSSAG